MGSAEQPSGGLAPHTPSLELNQLTLGIDNIRFDVFLSPSWREQAGQYLFEQILHYAQPTLRDLYPSDARARSASAAEFRRRTVQLLQEVLNQAKERNNVQVDLLARVAVTKWLVAELPRQFSQLAIACKEKVEKKGRVRVDDSMDAFVQRSKVADFQAGRRPALRAVGEALSQVLLEAEESTFQPSRNALFGSSFADAYQVFRNRMIFAENPNDAVIHLEHYVMLGHFQTDADREDLVVDVLAQLLRERGLALPEGDELAKLEQQRDKIVDSLQELNRRLREAEQELEELSGARSRGLGLSWLGGRRRTARPGVTQRDAERMVKVFEETRGELVRQVEELEAKIAFHRQRQEARLSEVLSNPDNA